MAERAQITVRGVVQGVGFRPFVHSLATGLGLTGYVTNTSEGVLIEVEGRSVDEFIARLRIEAPPLSRITDLDVLTHPRLGYRDFQIRQSMEAKGAFTLVSPDVSTCPECLEELLDPADRRYLYPFINCTNCGPRYSITRSVPYDRPNTTMAVFPMCPACSSEYHDPANRRFHAQPNACPLCGPRVEFREGNRDCGTEGRTALEECIRSLRNGRIISIKGLGGFHIACDAANQRTVRLLRERKRKSNKPFAVMAPNVDTIRRFCQVSPQEQQQLESIQRPIVLLQKRHDLPPDEALAEAVSPNNRYIGCMLPYTPLHQLLFHFPLTGAEGTPLFPALVMTSGNLSEEPIVHTNDDAQKRLGGLVDAFLLHDRDIFMRVDDSVVRVTSDERREARKDASDEEQGAPSIVTRPSSLLYIRRSRGYAPDPIALHQEGPEVLGCGADLKNTFTLTKGTFAIPSQHIGDMENYETLRFFEQTLENLKQVYRVAPEAIVHDLHPGYLSTRWAMEQGTKGDARRERKTLPAYAVQHHYAHIGSVMAEYGLTGPVIGVAFDGTGYGTDGGLWGGEFLVADIDGFERVGQFRDVPLPGGEAAVREPWRTAAGYCREAFGSDAEEALSAVGITTRHGQQMVRQVLQVSASAELSPRSSGAGRLFDAVAALMDVCDRNTFEGEAAMALEALVRKGIADDYPVELTGIDGHTVADFSPLVRAVVDDMLAGSDRGLMATKLHNTIVQVVRSAVRKIRERFGICDVALSGGTFQNQYLCERAVELLRSDGMRTYVNRAMPPNDACISLGQAYLIRERLKRC
jgi:hydrogenase maturation protein HypF